MTTSEARHSGSDLDTSHFREFFAEVHSYSPFPWQEALLERVHERGWPELIDVPTGLGKTSVLDVAIFLSALRSEHARRRTFLVVDRRLIVDQAHDEARKIERALTAARPGTVCSLIRERLAVPGDDSSVPDVTRMRGGLNWSWLWLERPDRHAIVTGTVDQIGSRLLFRGYGVGEQLRPIDAALVGSDSLIIVDEAHLSDAFVTTLKDVSSMDRSAICRPPMIVAMSASPGSSDAVVHRITAADESHPVAGRRLRAAKSLHPVALTSSADKAAAATADALSYWASQLGGPGKVVGVVANTVGMARAIFDRIRGTLGDRAECVLLTGRVRPIDREYLLDAWYPRIKSGVSRQVDAELYVVATQTIEVGADIDLDGLVTEVASLPATVQRLGRVNRMGERSSAPVVAVFANQLRDLVYGSARQETWQWLTTLVDPVPHKNGRSLADLGSGINVSPSALREHIAAIPLPQQEGMRGVTAYVPMISASALDVWARTSPIPHPDIPVAPYLHGIGAGEPTVSLVWRADMCDDDHDDWARSVARIPPATEEALELPISAVRKWLAQPVVPKAAATEQGTSQSPADMTVSDLESQAAAEPVEDRPSPADVARIVLRYRRADQLEAVTALQLKPGDLLIVPSSWGGCDRYGWNPRSATPVTDVADFAGSRRRVAAIRIGQVLPSAIRLLAPHLTEQIESFVSLVTNDISEERPDDVQYRARLGSMVGADEGTLPHVRVLKQLSKVGHLTEMEETLANDSIGGRVVALFAAPNVSWSDDESAAGTSVSSRKQLSLAGHQRAVRRRAGDFAENLGLSTALKHAVTLAALYHDEGKRDQRFQVMLHGGDRWRAEAASEPLAKSGMDPADRAAFRRAAVLSGYPSGMRHEALSARIAAMMLQPVVDLESQADGLDKELVVHLVSAHHGYARPLLPAIVDPEPMEITVPVSGTEYATIHTVDTVDWTGPNRFDGLCARYGRWGLALLEAIVRLADIWCSARSEECDEHDG